MLLADKHVVYVEEHTMASHQGMAATAEHATGVQDKTYNLVSVLYHALQGSETCQQYLHDAEEAGDQEMVQFFQEVQECQRHLASRARQMLMQRMREGNGHERMGQGQGRQTQRADGGASAHGHGMAEERKAGEHAPSSRDKK
jgi:hypothetical protein